MLNVIHVEGIKKNTNISVSHICKIKVRVFTVNTAIESNWRYMYDVSDNAIVAIHIFCTAFLIIGSVQYTK